MSETKKIVVLGGDGIGPEVCDEAVRVLKAVAELSGLELSFDAQLLGGVAIDETGDPLPEATRQACLAADAVLLGAVGGPKWDDPHAKVRPEQGLLGLRKLLGLYANLRPIKIWPSLMEASPLKADRLDGIDMLVVRELTGGIYFGFRDTESVEGKVRAFDTMTYWDWEVRRVVELAFSLAKGRKKRVTSVDKANVLGVSRLWRTVATKVGAEHPEVELEHQLVDSCAMRLITHAKHFDVIVTSNMFGDILTDEAGVLSGSLGVLPSASLGEGTRGLYEPIHGSAPDIAGQGIANPLGMILSAAMLLRHSLGRGEEASAVEAAVGKVLDDGETTPDLGGERSTNEVGDRVVSQLRATLGGTA